MSEPLRPESRWARIMSLGERDNAQLEVHVPDRETGEINQIWYVQEALSSGDVRKAAALRLIHLELARRARQAGAGS